LLELHSLAKIFSLGPVAVSFLVGDETIVSKLRDYSEFAWSDQSRLHIEVAVRYLQDRDHLATVPEIFRQRMQRLERKLTALGRNGKLL